MGAIPFFRIVGIQLFQKKLTLQELHSASKNSDFLKTSLTGFRKRTQFDIIWSSVPKIVSSVFQHYFSLDHIRMSNGRFWLNSSKIFNISIKNMYWPLKSQNTKIWRLFIDFGDIFWSRHKLLMFNYRQNIVKIRPKSSIKALSEKLKPKQRNRKNRSPIFSEFWVPQIRKNGSIVGDQWMV